MSQEPPFSLRFPPPAFKSYSAAGALRRGGSDESLQWPSRSLARRCRTGTAAPSPSPTRGFSASQADSLTPQVLAAAAVALQLTALRNAWRRRVDNAAGEEVAEPRLSELGEVGRPSRSQVSMDEELLLMEMETETVMEEMERWMQEARATREEAAARDGETDPWVHWRRACVVEERHRENEKVDKDDVEGKKDPGYVRAPTEDASEEENKEYRSEFVYEEESWAHRTFEYLEAAVLAVTLALLSFL